VLGANVPLKDLIDWLAGVGTSLVIEFITRDDPMVQTLLRHKVDHYDDYDTGYFERCLSAMFEIVRRETLASGTRILYHGTAKR
jgi:hypothetical protein